VREQAGDDVLQQDARAVVREVAQRQIPGVHDIHIEMHDNRLGPGRHRVQGALGHTGRVGGEGRSLLVADACVGQELAPSQIYLPGVAPDHGQPVRLKRRRRSGQVG